MGLLLRMIAYAFFTTVANQGISIYDPSTDIISFKLEEAILVVTGAGGFITTFVISRFARNK